MKKLLGLLAIAPMALAACSNNKTQIVLYTDIEAGDAAYDAVIKAFEEEHGVEIVLQTGSATELAATMAAEIDRDSRVADGFFSKNSMVQNAYSDYFATLSDDHINWDSLIQGATNDDKKFAGITYKTRIVASKDTTLATDFTLESLFAKTFSTDDEAVGMRWSGDYMAANMAAYFSAISHEEKDAADTARLDAFMANVERHAEAAARQNTAYDDAAWNARRLLVSTAKDYVDYAITNTYYYNRIENAQAFGDESLQGDDGKVATKEQWDETRMYYPDQGADMMGAYTDFNSGSVVKGTEHQDTIEQLIAAFHETDSQQNIWEEKEFYPAVKGTYNRTDDAIGPIEWITNDDFKSMNVEVGYDVMAEYWDEAMIWIDDKF